MLFARILIVVCLDRVIRLSSLVDVMMMHTSCIHVVFDARLPFVEFWPVGLGEALGFRDNVCLHP